MQCVDLMQIDIKMYLETEVGKNPSPPFWSFIMMVYNAKEKYQNYLKERTPLSLD